MKPPRRHPPAPPTIQADKVLAIGDQHVAGDVNVYQGAGSAAPDRIPVHTPPRHLPPREAKFAGREAELQELHAQLGRAVAVGITQQAALHGHGGIGKTSLGVEYGWRHLGDYPGGVFFLSCESALPPPVAELAPHLGLRTAETAEETAQSVKAHLETGKPCLLILDNVTGAKAWRDHEWSRHLPRGACRRLVTTRASSLPEVAMYALQRLSTDDGVRLLATYRGDVEAHEGMVRAVVEWFDGLAVGLTVVGVYLDRHPAVSWNGYVRSLEGKGLGTVRLTEEAAGPLPNDYEARVDAVFDDLLDSLPEPERRALEYAALLPEDQVYAPWVAELLSLDGEIELPALPGYEGVAGEPVVHALVKIQLLRARGEAEQVLGLHRVLRRRVRERLAEDGLVEVRVDAVAALAERRGEASYAALTDTGLRRELSPLAALSRELDELGRVPAAASLANWVSQPLRAMGRYKEAHDLLATFTGPGREEVLPPGAEATLHSNLGLILKALGDLGEARRRMERAIEIDERHFDPDHPTLAISYSNLAGILQDQGDVGEARRRMERAIEIGERNFDPDHPTLAVSYSNLAMILRDLGELGEARRRMERAIEIWERHFDPDHPTLAIRYSNLAMILQDQGDLGEARRRMERAIEIEERNFDPDHPTLAISYNNLAHLEVASGNRDRACSLFRRAKRILEKHFTPEHPNVQIVSASIARLCSDGGETGESDA